MQPLLSHPVVHRHRFPELSVSSADCVFLTRFSRGDVAWSPPCGFAHSLATFSRRSFPAPRVAKSRFGGPVHSCFSNDSKIGSCPQLWASTTTRSRTR